MKKKLEWIKLLLPGILISVLVLISAMGKSPVLKNIPDKMIAKEEIAEQTQEPVFVTMDPDDLKKISKKKKTATSKKNKKQTYDKPKEGYKDGSYTGSAQGYGGVVGVKVVVSEGKITNVSIVSASQETPSFFAKAKVVTERIVQAQSPNVDVVSGATYSSNGIINAVIEALKKAGGKDIQKKMKATASPTKSASPEETKKPVSKVPGNATYADGEFTGTGEGWGGNIKVKVTIKNEKITSICIVSAENETPAYFSKAKSILTTMKKKQNYDVDVISGATYSSNGIKSAVYEALQVSIEKAQKQNGKVTVEATPKPTRTPSKEQVSASEETEKTNEAETETVENGEVKTEETQTEEVSRDDGSVVTVTKTTLEKEVNGTSICYPDNSMDFEEYGIEMLFKICVETITTTTTQNGESSIEESSSYKLLDMDFSADTKKTTTKDGNWFYLKRAIDGFGTFNGIKKQLLQQENLTKIDAVSGATCSSDAIFEAYKNALLQVK